LSAICSFDQTKLNSVLRDTDHKNLLFSAKDFSQLQELVSMLTPFAEATDLTQGETVVTLSCVVPIILSIQSFFRKTETQPSPFSNLVKTLLQSLYDRFAGIFALLNIPVTLSSKSKDLRFNNEIFLMATALDPAYAYHWIQDHSGSPEEKELIRYKING
jgi:hypothetical protein